MADSKKYDGSQWEHSLRKFTTATEAVENPLYSDGTPITSYTIKGNMVQSGTPAPSNPVPVVGVGELETTGEHTGEYKIPISSGSVTTNIELASTQTTRQIKKVVYNGTEENWRITGTGRMGIPLNDLPLRLRIPYCTHFIGTNVETYGNMSNGECSISVVNGSVREFGCYDSTITTLADFKSWLATQYANGTPVTVWYVLATPTTGIVNEPLMKIGDYADTLSNATAIPTTEGANSITVGTTVQPSEFTATWTGWHNASVKEKSRNLLDINNAIIGVAWNTSLNNNRATIFLSCEPDTDYCFSSQTTGLDLIYICEKVNSSSTTGIDNTGQIYSSPISFTTTSASHCIAIQFNKTNISMQDIDNINSMLNTGSTALPYEPYWK